MCKLCGKQSLSDTCGRCMNIIALQIERKAKHRLQPTSEYFEQLRTFEERVAMKGPANRVVSWDIVDTLTNGVIEHE